MIVLRLRNADFEYVNHQSWVKPLLVFSLSIEELCFVSFRFNQPSSSNCATEITLNQVAEVKLRRETTILLSTFIPRRE